MSRRHDRRRRAARRERETLDIHPASDAVDFARAFARWRSFVATATSRGFDAPPFETLMFGPVVRLDPGGDDPHRQLSGRTLDEVVRITRAQRPS